VTTTAEPPATTSSAPTETYGPPPGPVGAEVPTPEALPPNVVQIPGMDPITLPAPAPPAPAPAPLP
jgi:hypothetical protein